MRAASGPKDERGPQETRDTRRGPASAGPLSFCSSNQGRSKGRPLAGRKAPYGYRWLPNVVDDEGRPLIVKPGLQVDSVTAPVVRRIFDALVRGMTLRALAITLEGERIPTPTGKGAWQHTTLRAILTNPVYIGQPMAYRTVRMVAVVDGSRKKVVRARPEAEQVALADGAAPALVSADVFARAQARMRLNSEQSTRNNRAPELTLLRGGYIRCGYDGYTMIVRRGKVVRYRCGHSLKPTVKGHGHAIAASTIDKATWDEARRILRTPELVAAALEALRANDPSEADLAAVDRDIGAADRQQRNLVDNLGELNAAAAGLIRAKLEELVQRRQSLEMERQAILGRQRSWRAAQERVGDIQRWCRTVSKNADRLTYEQRRQVLDMLGIQVRAWRADHEPHYTIDALPLDRLIVDSSAGSS